jgi:glycine cleavage system H protein
MCPDHLRYTKEHEWVKIEGETAEIGITDYAQEQLGDVVYVELPEPGARLGQFEVCGTIESVKTVADLYAPLSGEVVAINDALDETPELVNTEPYGAGWIVKIQISDPGEVSNLLSPADYETLIKKK